MFVLLVNVNKIINNLTVVEGEIGKNNLYLSIKVIFATFFIIRNAIGAYNVFKSVLYFGSIESLFESSSIYGLIFILGLFCQVCRRV